MPRRKKIEPVVVIERPEPEGQGDWLYTCTDCGYQRKDSVTFNQPCPKCGGHGWMCQWLEMPRTANKKPEGGAADPKNNNGERRGNKPDPIKGRADILLPLNRKPVASKRGNSRGLSPALGRPETILPTDLINRLADQGLGCKAIAIKLQEKGILISHMTIQRRLKAREDRQQAHLEFR